MGPNDELAEELRASARKALDDRMPTTVLRQVIDTEDGIDRSLYALAADLGWLGLTLPESVGGSGGSWHELAVVLEEIGRALAPLPMIASVVVAAGAVMLAGDDEQQQRLIPGIADGSAIATGALFGASGRPDEPLAARVERRDGSLVLSGVSGFVPDAHVSSWMVVAATDGAVPTLVVVDSSAPGVRIERLDTTDVTRRLAHVHFDDVVIPSANVLASADAQHVIDELVRRAGVAIALDSVGGLERVVEITVAYVGEREQFGRKVGSFQAVKHHCANLLVFSETARVAGRAAADAIDGARWVEWAAIAKSYSGDTYTEATRIAVQCFGGVGFTWEYDIHFYMKRARLSQQLFGSPTYHRQLLTRELRGRTAD